MLWIAYIAPGSALWATFALWRHHFHSLALRVDGGVQLPSVLPSAVVCAPQIITVRHVLPLLPLAQLAQYLSLALHRYLTVMHIDCMTPGALHYHLPLPPQLN